MLNGIPSVLTGDLLAHLDRMGHGDTVVISDAHFPADRLGSRLVDLAGLSAPEAVAAICAVFPLDYEMPAVSLMDAPDRPLPVQQELLSAAAAEASDVGWVERFAFYDLAAAAYLIVRTGEQRIYANALLRKGIAQPQEGWRV